jgi:hypothetical protein
VESYVGLIAVIVSGVAAAVSSWLGYHTLKEARRDLAAKRQLLVSVKDAGVEIIHDARVAATAKDSLFDLLGVHPESGIVARRAGPIRREHSSKRRSINAQDESFTAPCIASRIAFRRERPAIGPGGALNTFTCSPRCECPQFYPHSASPPTYRARFAKLEEAQRAQ